jgi:hypothetical protein
VPAAADANASIDIVAARRATSKPGKARLEVKEAALRPGGIGKVIDDALRAAGLIR